MSLFGKKEKESNNVLDKIIRLRGTVPTIESGTVMQKIINPCQLNEYLYKGKTNVTGWASKAADISPWARNLDEGVRHARLDYFIPNRTLPGTYDGNDFKRAINNGEDMYVLRFMTVTTPDNTMYPKADEYNRPPCTGTGFTASSEHLIPEFTYSMRPDGTVNQLGVEISSGAIFKINPQSEECLIAMWDEIVGHFIPVE